MLLSSRSDKKAIYLIIILQQNPTSTPGQIYCATMPIKNMVYIRKFADSSVKYIHGLIFVVATVYSLQTISTSKLRR